MLWLHTLHFAVIYGNLNNLVENIISAAIFFGLVSVLRQGIGKKMIVGFLSFSHQFISCATFWQGIKILQGSNFLNINPRILVQVTETKIHIELSSIHDVSWTSDESCQMYVRWQLSNGWKMNVRWMLEIMLECMTPIQGQFVVIFTIK